MGRYRAYRDYQGVPSDWLGEIPSHWQTRRLGALFSRKKKTGFTDEELLSVYRDYGVIPKASREDNFNKPSDDLSPYQLVEPGDLVLNKMKTWQGSIAVSEYRGIVSPAYFTYRPEKHVYGTVLCPKYVHYLVRSPVYITQYLRLSKGIRVNQWDLDPDTFKTLELVIPPHDEQEVISAFLDHETAKIDRLIARQERLIELLKEKRQAVISHAVTKGLNPDAPMKDSGVEWLGEVPAHWEVSKIKFHVTTFEQGWSPQCENRLAEDGEFGVLKVGCVNSGTFNASEHKALPPELDPRTEYRLLKGDLLVSRANTRGLVGSAAVVDKDYRWLLLCDKLYRIRLDNRCLPEFLSYFLGIRVVRDQIELGSSGASQSMQNIGQDTIKNLPLPLPGNSEAKDILEFVRDKLERFSLLEERTRTAIELMKEHRTALISAAVTGKIDVRDWRKPNTEPQEAATAVSA